MNKPLQILPQIMARSPASASWQIARPLNAPNAFRITYDCDAELQASFDATMRDVTGNRGGMNQMFLFTMGGGRASAE